MSQNQCGHAKSGIYQMYWPDGGTAEFCSGCFATRHSDDVMETEWQNHGFKCLGDWYREAAKVADGIDYLVRRAKSAEPSATANNKQSKAQG